VKGIADEIKGKRVFVTGGAGFIGSTIAERLVDSNEVVAYDHLRRNALGDKTLLAHPNFTLVEGDVLDLAHLREAMTGADLVVHCAGVAGIDTVGKRPVETLRVNIIGSFNTIDAARDVGSCERVLCFSTSEIFGQFAFRSTETDRAVVGEVGEARWTYAVGKLAEEHLAVAAYKEWGLGTAVVRPFNVYGPGQVGEGALRTFVIRALRDEPIVVHGDGSQIRAWCYVDDMVEGALLALTVPGAAGESFNIGNARASTTIYDLAQRVVRVLGSRSTIELVPRDAPDIELRVPSIAKAQSVLGFEPTVDLDEGIERTGQHFRRLLDS
jgi:UDP-glucose 4-epimerase